MLTQNMVGMSHDANSEDYDLRTMKHGSSQSFSQ